MQDSRHKPMQWRIDRTDILYEGFYQLSRVHLQHEKFAGGWSGEVRREMLQRGNVGAVLPYDPDEDAIVLVEQFRIGAMHRETPWLLEVIAGMVEEGEVPQDMVRREAREEAGLELDQLEPVMNYLSNPGNTTEEVFVFAATTSLADAGGLFGVASEHEDIRVRKFSSDEAIALLDDGALCNAVTVIAMQWFKANRERLRNRA